MFLLEKGEHKNGCCMKVEATYKETVQGYFSILQLAERVAA